jgi:hypothetical protein
MQSGRTTKKKIWAIVSILLALIIALSIFIFYKEFNSVHRKLVGEWKGVGRDTTWGFLFESDGSARPIRHGAVLDKSPYGMKLEWKINDAIEPYQLDVLTIYHQGDTDTWRMIFRFVDENKIELCEGGVQNSRPEAFSKNNSHILVRQ